jgi:hypothetical protein
MTRLHGTGGGPTAGTELLAGMSAFRARVRSRLVVERLAQAVAFGLLAIAAAAVLDRALRLPSMARLLELAALLAGGAAWAWFRVLPAIRFRPPLVEVALRLERGDARSDGVLAVGTDLAAAGEADPGSLAAAAVERGRGSMAWASGARIDSRPARRATAAALMSLSLCAALAWLAPGTARIALLRLATPFADIQWPARTMVEPAMAAPVHARGTALALRARVTRGEPASMRVEATYRVLRDGDGEWRTVTMAAQPDGTFERLVEADGEAVEASFRTEDMETATVTVRLVPPPGVREARVTVTPPAYAAGSVDVRSAELGDGTDRRATLSPPVLAGSAIELAVVTEGADAPPADPAALDAWVARTMTVAGLDGEAIAPGFEASADEPSRWTIRWQASGRGVVELRPTGAEGIAPAERIAFEIPAVEDAAPTVAIVDPPADESVTPDAVPTVVAEARDDLAVRRIWLEAAVVRGGAEPRVAMSSEGTPGAQARAEMQVRVRDTGAEPGDRIVCVARAIDAFEAGGKGREPVTSGPRVFRVIAASELAEQVRSRLGQMREAAQRLREEQAGVAEATEAAARRTGESGAEATEQERAQLSGSQGRMADRVAAFDRSLAELSARLERNNAPKDGLSEAIEEARGLAQAAAKDAQRAAEATKDATRTEEATQAARTAERSLADLAASLDRDRATAELSRRIDRLAERIESAQRETREAASRSVGKERAQLPQDVRERLDRAAQEQREAAAEARALSEDLGRRAEEVAREEGRDPGAAEAMREAQQEADRGGLARQLEQGAQQTEENQVQAAQQSQARAGEAVSRMQEAMRNQRKRRMEELERRVTAAVDAIKALLADVEDRSLPLQRLGAEDPAAAESESKEALRLARNAGGVAESVAQAGDDLRRSATLVVRGAEQLDATAVALRTAPARLEQARESFEGARQSVQEALAAAQKAQRDAERAAENRRREELRGAYAQVLERQRSARAGTEAIVPPAGRPLDRRGFIESRRVAAEQASVTGLLEAMAARPDIAGSELYSASNQELVSSSKAAASELSASSVSRRTVMAQREVEAGIAALVEALADAPEPDDPFAEANRKAGGNQQQGGGGAGGERDERVPPIAELRLLRTMAQRVLDDTAAAGELPETDRAPYLARVAARQSRILELGERWAKAMKEAQEAQGAGVQGGGSQ